MVMKRGRWSNGKLEQNNLIQYSIAEMKPRNSLTQQNRNNTNKELEISVNIIEEIWINVLLLQQTDLFITKSFHLLPVSN